MTVAHTGIADYLSNTLVAAAWNARHTNIVSVMRKWYEFEPSAGVYSFGNLKTAGDGIQFAHDHDILLFIRFMAGCDAPVGRPGVSTGTHPDWLTQAPYSVPRFRTLDNDSGTPDRELWMPHLWNATYLSRYLLAVDAWNTWFESNCPGSGPTHKVATHMSGFSISGITENGAEENISPGQRHKYTNGTTTWPTGYGADYVNPQSLAPGSMSASGTVTGIPSTAAFTVPGLFKISSTNSTAYAATDELVYATGKTATTLTTSGGGGRGWSGTTAQAHSGGTAEIQVVTLPGFSAGDSFTLTAEGNTTPSFVHSTNATASAIQAALRTATGNNTLTVTGTANAGPFTVTWAGESGNQATMTGVGVGCTVTVTTQTQGTLGQEIRQADQSNTTAVHTATFNGLTGLYDHSRLNAQQWFNADGLDYAGRTAQLASLWRQNIIDVIAHLTSVRPGWAGGALWGDALDSAIAQLEELGPIYREQLHVITTNLSAKPPRTSSSDPIPTYESSFPSYFTWLKRAQELGCSTSVQTQGVSSTGAQNGQQIIDACETGLVEFDNQLEYIETNGNSRFSQTNGGAGWNTWAAYGWPGGHIDDMEDYFVSFDGSFPQNLQERILGSQLGIGSANLSGTGGSSIAGRRTRKGAATLVGTGSSSSAGKRLRKGRATIAGLGSLVTTGVVTGTGGTGWGQTAWGLGQWGGVGSEAATATLTGVGSQTVAGVRERKGAATLTGTGSQSAAGTHLGLGAATLTGSGSLVATFSATQKQGAATLTGAGSSTIASIRERKAAATIAGTGGSSVAGALIRTAQATLTGTGASSVGGSITKVTAASLTGTGSSSVTAAVIILTSGATLTGTGSLTVRLPVEAGAILTGQSSERIEGHIVSSVWPQSYADEWEDALV